MTVIEELYLMGIPESECGPLAKKLIDAAAISGYPNALGNILDSVRFLIQKDKPASNVSILRALNLDSSEK